MIKNLKVGIINLEIHNLFSIYEACKKIGYKTSIIQKSTKNYNFDIIILPGVGSYRFAMKKISQENFKYEINNHLQKQNKILFGICLGMQLLFTKSEEFGYTKGLDIIPGEVIKIDNKSRRVPHTGWNEIILKKKSDYFFDKTLLKKKFYFTHSYYCKPKFQKHVCTITNYSGFNFCSSVKKGNVIATQFHPEKSGAKGLKIIKDLPKFI